MRRDKVDKLSNDALQLAKVLPSLSEQPTTLEQVYLVSATLRSAWPVEARDALQTHARLLARSKIELASIGDDEFTESGLKRFGLPCLIPSLAQSEVWPEPVSLALHTNIRSGSAATTEDVDARLPLTLPTIAHGIRIVPLRPEDLPAQYL